MLRNKIGPSFDAKKVFFFSFFWLVFLKNLILPAERRGFLKNKKRKKREKLDQVLTQKKAIFGPSFDSTAYIYIYIKLGKNRVHPEWPSMLLASEHLR